MKRTKSSVGLVGLIGISMGITGCLENVYDSYDSYKTGNVRLRENKPAVSVNNYFCVRGDNKGELEFKVELGKHECFILSDNVDVPDCFASSHLDYKSDGRHIYNIGGERGMGIYNGQNITLFFVWDMEREERYNGKIGVMVDIEVRKKCDGLMGASCSSRKIELSFKENSGNYGNNSPEFSNGQFSRNHDIINRIVHNEQDWRIGQLVSLKISGGERALYELKATSTLVDKYGDIGNKKEIGCYVFVDGAKELSQK